MVNYNKNFEGEVFSYKVVNFSSSTLENANFHKADFVKSVVTDYEFENCDMSHMDAKGAYFRRCKFYECDFKHSNFTNAIFEDCVFIYKKDESINYKTYKEKASLFEKAGMFGAIFKKCKFENCYIKGVGFRYVKFKECKFTNLINYSVSFENATIENCTFDTFDIRSSAVHGLVIDNINFNKLICRFEKSIQIIGIDQVYKNYNHHLKIDENEKRNLIIFSHEKIENNIKLDITSLLEHQRNHFENINIFFILDSLNKLNENELKYDTIKNRLIEINSIYNNMKTIERVIWAYISYLKESRTFLDIEDKNSILKLLFFHKFGLINVYEEIINYTNVRDCIVEKEEPIVEKLMFEYYKSLYKKNITKLEIELDETFNINRVADILIQMKKLLESKGLYESCHYNISAISSGSIKIKIKFILEIGLLLSLINNNIGIKTVNFYISNDKISINYNETTISLEEIKQAIGHKQNNKKIGLF